MAMLRIALLKTFSFVEKKRFCQKKRPLSARCAKRRPFAKSLRVNALRPLPARPAIYMVARWLASREGARRKFGAAERQEDFALGGRLGSTQWPLLFGYLFLAG